MAGAVLGEPTRAGQNNYTVSHAIVYRHRWHGTADSSGGDAAAIRLQRLEMSR
jgi:hypothetical protein